MSDDMEPKLLARCLKGDPDAWDALFDTHYSATGRFVFQLGPDLTAEDVEEVCQETFLSVIRNLRRFKGGCQLQTWIFRIAANKARDYRDKRLAAKRGGGQAPIPLDAPNPDTGRNLELPANDPGPDLALLKHEESQLIGCALEQLEQPCREVIQLRYFGDLSYEEISGVLGLNIKTVSSRLSKCLDRLEEIARKIFSMGNCAIMPSNE